MIYKKNYSRFDFTVATVVDSIRKLNCGKFNRVLCCYRSVERQNRSEYVDQQVYSNQSKQTVSDSAVFSDVITSMLNAGRRQKGLVY